MLIYLTSINACVLQSDAKHCLFPWDQNPAFLITSARVKSIIRIFIRMLKKIIRESVFLQKKNQKISMSIFL